MEDMKLIMEEMMKKQWEQKVRIFKELNLLAKKGEIVFTGSSLAENFPINEMLKSLSLDYTVYNRGIGGDVTDGLLKRMSESVYELKPKKVFINIGTNDISRPDYTREKLMSNYKEILKLIEENCQGVEIFIMSYYPVNRELPWLDPNMVRDMFGARTNEELVAVNKELEGVAGENGYTYIDVFTPLLDEHGNLKEEYAVDGMHMYPNGYKAVLDILIKYFE